MRFIVRRLGFYVVAAWAAVTINFVIPRVMPGNAVEAMMAQVPEAAAGGAKALEIEFGVGHQGSLLHQYLRSTSATCSTATSGISVSQYPAKVSTSSADAPLDAGARRHRDGASASRSGRCSGSSPPGGAAAGSTSALPAFTFLQAMPYFFLALLAIQLFSLDWHVFPIGRATRSGSCRASTGRSSPARSPLDPAGADDHRHLDGRLDAADAQRDDHDDRRGLRAGRAGQGPLDPRG